MTSASQPTLDLRYVLHLLIAYRYRWLAPAVVVGLLAGVYAFAVYRPTWEGSQALIVRNEAAGSQDGPGKFSHADPMKTTQETILELAKSHGVLADALGQLPPPADYDGLAAVWPRPRDVDALSQALKLVPPKGAEFGKTEVFYLKVQDHDRDRAVALVAAVCDRLETAFQQLRNAKAGSMIDELAKAVTLARADLTEATSQLARIETQVGSDLAELRILHDSSSGDSALRRTITEIRSELRQVGGTAKANHELLTLLKEAQNDPDRVVGIANQLIESQPALRRLKEGLMDAKLRTSQLRGSMSEQHPIVQAAKESEREIGQQLHNELAAAIRGVQIDLRLNIERTALLEDQLAAADRRLGRLSGLRATYANLIAESRNRTTLLERAEQRLAEAQATHATATTASQIARVDVPDAGIRPIGLGRKAITLVGIFGGLAVGWAVLFLTIPAPASAASGLIAAWPAVGVVVVDAVAPLTAMTVQSFSTEPPAIPAPAHNRGTKSPLLPASNLTLKGALTRIHDSGCWTPA